MHKIPALGILSCLLLAIAGCGGDSDTPDADAAVGYIPDKAFAAIVIYPQRALKSSVAKRLGIDKLLGSLSEGDLPFDVAKVEQITVVFASAEEEPLVIFQFSEAQDKGKMLAFRLFKELEKLTHNGKEYYGRNEFSSSEAVTFPDDRTMIVAVSSDQMKEVLSASGSSGLGKALGEVDGDYDLIAVVQLALVRADLQSLLSEKDDDLANLPNQVETIIATGKLDPTLRVDIVVKTISDDAAKEVESTIRMGVGMAVGAMGVLGQAAGDTMGPAPPAS